MEIRFDKVHKTYLGQNGPLLALEEISLDISEGEFVCLVGPSGCGKSTLLNILAGFDRPTGGVVTLDGEVVREPSIERAMMFQEAALFPWLSALGNVEFGLKSLGLDAKTREIRAREFLEMVQLGSFANAQPHELSGGMKQRVALARALAVRPKVLLMDEPFAALDAQTRDLLGLELSRLWRETGKTVLFVTHNVLEAASLATRVLVFTARPGRIKREFDLADLPFPRETARVAQIVSDIQDALRDEVLQVERAELAGVTV